MAQTAGGSDGGGMTMAEDRCICCGAIIPEGNLACSNCLVYVKKEGSEDDGKKEKIRQAITGDDPV